MLLSVMLEGRVNISRGGVLYPLEDLPFVEVLFLPYRYI